MFYNSTRDKKIRLTSSEAILKGISTDGGLFIPEKLPIIPVNEINKMSSMTYQERAKFILSLFLTDFSENQISECVENAYNDKFEFKDIATLKSVGEYNFLELWHGPTCAFKDMALQLLPRLLSTSMKINKTEKEIVILVATSGDTGKAALEGFKDIENTKIIVFYPTGGVSEIQKRQMQTQQGNNVSVCAIDGNFDDAQTGVKKIFADKHIEKILSENSIELSSANSINWGRLVPQIVYYFSAYADMVMTKKIIEGEKINFTVPTGNFGNILAGYFAKEMGLPINKLICASNENKVLTDFIKTGVYDKNRKFHLTISPSMDILISSNLERLLYLLSGCDDEYINSIFAQLNNNGCYKIKNEILSELQEIFYADYCDDDETLNTIKSEFKNHGYLCDSHTAVALNVYEKYLKNTNDKTKNVIVSTANPYKFSSNVLKAVDDDYNKADDEFIMMEKLFKKTDLNIPQQLKSLKEKKTIFNECIKKSEMTDFLLNFLKIK